MPRPTRNAHVTARPVPAPREKSARDALASLVLQVLMKKAACQLTAEEEEDGDDADDQDGARNAERDGLLRDAASDVTSAMALALGPAFELYFRQFLPRLQRFAVRRLTGGRVEKAGACTRGECRRRELTHRPSWGTARPSVARGVAETEQARAGAFHGRRLLRRGG